MWQTAPWLLLPRAKFDSVILVRLAVTRTAIFCFEEKNLRVFFATEGKLIETHAVKRRMREVKGYRN